MSVRFNWTVALVSTLVIAAWVHNESPGSPEGSFVIGGIGGLIVGKYYRQFIIIGLIVGALYLAATQ